MFSLTVTFRTVPLNTNSLCHLTWTFRTYISLASGHPVQWHVAKVCLLIDYSAWKWHIRIAVKINTFTIFLSSNWFHQMFVFQPKLFTSSNQTFELFWFSKPVFVSGVLTRTPYCIVSATQQRVADEICEEHNVTKPAVEKPCETVDCTAEYVKLSYLL